MVETAVIVTEEMNTEMNTEMNMTVVGAMNVAGAVVTELWLQIQKL